MRLVAHMEKSANRKQSHYMSIEIFKASSDVSNIFRSVLCQLYSFMYLAFNNLEICIYLFIKVQFKKIRFNLKSVKSLLVFLEENFSDIF